MFGEAFGGCRAVVLTAVFLLAACSGSKKQTGGLSGAECDAEAGAGPSLITNGSFEEPAVAVGGFSVFAKGQTFGGWTVIGADGNVAPLSGSFADAGFAFPAEDGQQSVDMTGTSQSATGLSQTVATTPGHTYCLSFWVGNVYDPDNTKSYGTTSTINVLVDGQLVTVATDEDEDTTLSWEPYTSTVVATSASTTIAFVNGDPTSDSSNFLDNVTLK
jgi:archaellum component FlaF (FlaF/FlaG flagellin family)